MSALKNSQIQILTLLLTVLLSGMLAACGTTDSNTGTRNPGGPMIPASPPATSTTPTAAPSTSTSTPATTPQAKPTKPLIAIRMLNSINGWALTETEILRTSDGGTTWHDVTPSGATLNRVTKGDFVNSQAAWIATPDENGNVVTILRTLNGGQTWSSSLIHVPGPDSVDVPHFFNLTTGWIEIITNGGPGMGNESADIWHSTDGGASWQRIATTDQPASGLTREGFKSGISFRDTLNGWATTGSDTGRPQNPGLYVTHDGGKTWQKQNLNYPAGPTPEGMGTTPPVFFGNTGILPVNVTLPVGKQALVLYVSRDGGNTWTPTTPAQIAPSTVYVIDPQHTWAAVTQTGDFTYTNNGGQSWQSAKGVPGEVLGMSFTDPTHGWAINGSLLLHTSNGTAWEPIHYTIY